MPSDDGMASFLTKAFNFDDDSCGLFRASGSNSPLNAHDCSLSFVKDARLSPQPGRLQRLKLSFMGQFTTSPRKTLT
jgi:hypothetical protein